MRERTDKSFPNGYNTAVGVCKSIMEPVTEEMLLHIVKNPIQNMRSVGQKRPSNEMPPPPPKFAKMV